MIIQNGDHMEFERQHAGTPKEQREDWPLPSYDAIDWAKAFNKQFPSVSVDDAFSWFACALVRGYDEGVSRTRSDTFLQWLGRRNWWVFRFNGWLQSRKH